MKRNIINRIVSILMIMIVFTGGVYATGTTIQALLAEHVKIQLNGVEFDMKNAEGEIVHPIAYNGSVYVPIRAVSENLGIGVQWDQENQVVKLSEAPSDANSRGTSGADTGGANDAGGSGGTDNADNAQNSNHANDTGNGSDTDSNPNGLPEDPNEAALKAAQNLSKVMRLSKKGLQTLLMSADGGKHSEAAAIYAVDHIEIDWKQNALDTANFFRGTVGYAEEQVKNHLLNVEQYTEEEAEYAVRNMKP